MLNKKTKIFKFKNGATLIYKKRKLCSATAVVAGFCAGHNYIDKIHGMPHLVEHLLLKGTNKRSYDDIISDKIKITGLNAFTSAHQLAVNFYESNKRIDECFEFASDVLLNTKVNENVLQNEKSVVLEEKARKIDAVKKNLYEQHFRFIEPKFILTEDYRLGTQEGLKNVTSKDIYEFINKHFVSDKFFLCTASSLSFKKIKKLAKKYFVNSLIVPKNKSEIIPYENYSLGANEGLFVAKTEDDTIKCIVSIKFEVENGIDYMFDYNFNCITSNMNKQSNAFYNMARKQGLVYSAGASINYNNLSNSMTIDFEFVTSKLENVDKIFSLIGDTVKLFKENYVSNEGISDYIENAIISKDKAFPSRYQDSVDRYLNQYYNYGKIFDVSKKQSIKNLKAVNINDIKKNIDLALNKNNPIFITFMGNYSVSDFKTIEEYKSIIFKD